MTLKHTIIASVLILSTIIARGQEQNEGLKGSETVKMQLNFNPYEVGCTVSHQHYLGQRTGLQTNISLLFPMEEEGYKAEDYMISGFGYRINPEFRFYPSRKKINRKPSFFIGGGPVIKSYQMKEREWNHSFDKNTGTPYQKLSVVKYDNFSYGVMAVLGLEGYFDKSQRFVFDASYSFGLTSNRIKMTGDTEIDRDTFFLEDISVSNRNSGLLPYVDIRMGVGYRFSKKMK